MTDWQKIGANIVTGLAIALLVFLALVLLAIVCSVIGYGLHAGWNAVR